MKICFTVNCCESVCRIPRLFCHVTYTVNPLESRGNYSATSNNLKLLHWPLMGGLLHLVQQRGDWSGPSLPRPLLAVPNVTAHPSTASVPIAILLYNGLLLCSFNVGIKWLNMLAVTTSFVACLQMDITISSGTYQPALAVL